jgi:cyclic pyranopterin phosphate synthase
MVDVSSKQETLRQADAEAILWVGSEVIKAIRDGRTPKGNIFETARIAGVMGAKRTSDLIPHRDSHQRTHPRRNRGRNGGAHCGFGCGVDVV